MALDEIQAKFGGRWEMVRSENFEDFLKGVGHDDGYAYASAAVGNVEQEIEVKDGKIRIYVTHGDWVRDDLFQLNEPLYYEMNQVKYKAIASYKDGKLEKNIQPIDSDLSPHKIAREIIHGELVVTFYVKDVVAQRVFKHL